MMHSRSLYIHLHALFWLFTLATALPAPTAESDKRGAPATQFYYGVDSATHQKNIKTYSAKGYRIISLSAYGSPSAATYAASWVQRTGPAWVAIHGANNATFQSWFNNYTSSGYVPKIVAATGPRNSAVYAGVMEQTALGWTQYCDMTSDDIARNMQAASSVGQNLVSFREYGTPDERRYCAVWNSNSNLDHQDWFGYPMSAADYQITFDSETSKPYYRPLQVSVSEDINYTAVFTDNSVGAWVARHGLTAAQLKTEQATQQSAGRYVIHISGGGSGANARYAAIFAAQDIPSKRTWRVTGSAAVKGWVNNANVSASTEQMIKSWMQSTGVRQVQLSISRNASALLDRAYTWSEPERPTTQVQDPFLLASLSKAFNEAVIQHLFDIGKLSPNTTVYPLLGYSNPADPRAMNVTVQQLLDHYSGYDRDIAGDPLYNMRYIAQVQSNGARPATMKDVVDYMFARPLDHNPGEVYAYSNYGYLLLSYVVEQVMKTNYYDYLQKTILTPEKLTVKPWLSDPATHVNDNVIQESDYTGYSARQPLYNNQVAYIYGGDGQYKESALGCVSLAANAQSLSKFIGKHAVWGNGPRRPGYYREGSTPGANTWLESRWDNLDWALTVSTREYPYGALSMDDFAPTIDTYLNGAVQTS